MADLSPPRPWFRRWSLVLPALVLVAAGALQSLDVFREKPQPRGAHLQRYIPADLPGWQQRDLPLGANEAVAREAEKILNFDEVVNREYRRGEIVLSVYVGYWSAGRMPTRLVASHTPDRCWTENGWQCLEMKFHESRSVAGAALLPAEWRLFRPPSGAPTTHVLYWHLVAGELYDYGARFNAVPHPLLWWKDAVRQALKGSSEQYFIRLTSNVPFERVWSDPGLVQVLQGLRELGLDAGGATVALAKVPAR